MMYAESIFIFFPNGNLVTEINYKSKKQTKLQKKHNKFCFYILSQTQLLFSEQNLDQSKMLQYSNLPRVFPIINDTLKKQPGNYS